MTKLSETFPEPEYFSYPPELQFSLRSLLSINKIKDLRHEREEYRRLNYPALSSLYDKGGRVGAYSDRDGPTVTLAKIVQNVAHGRPAGKDIPPDPLNDPASP